MEKQVHQGRKQEPSLPAFFSVPSAVWLSHSSYPRAAPEEGADKAWLSAKGAASVQEYTGTRFLLTPGTKKKRKIIVSHVTCQGLVTPTPQARADDLDWMLKLWLPRRVLAAAQLRGPLPLTSKPACW